MGKRNVKDTIKLTVIGGILFVFIMVAGTIWVGRKASSDSLDAVRKVSLLFMEEMTARREQVVASTLADYIKDLDVAIGLISKEDLASQESLQNYQTRMKQLYALRSLHLLMKTVLSTHPEEQERILTRMLLIIRPLQVLKFLYGT